MCGAGGTQGVWEPNPHGVCASSAFCICRFPFSVKDLIRFCLSRDRSTGSVWRYCEVLLSRSIKQHPSAPPKLSQGLCTCCEKPPGAEGRSCSLALVLAAALARLSHQELLLRNSACCSVGLQFPDARARRGVMGGSEYAHGAFLIPKAGF